MIPRWLSSLDRVESPDATSVAGQLQFWDSPKTERHATNEMQDNINRFGMVGVAKLHLMRADWMVTMHCEGELALRAMPGSIFGG